MKSVAALALAVLALFALAANVAAHTAQPACGGSLALAKGSATVDVVRTDTDPDQTVYDNAPGNGVYAVAAGTYTLVWSDGFTITGLVVGACEQPTPTPLPSPSPTPQSCANTPNLCPSPTPSPTPTPVPTPSPTPSSTPTPDPTPTPETLVPPTVTLPPTNTDGPSMPGGANGAVLAFVGLLAVAGVALLTVRRRDER